MPAVAAALVAAACPPASAGIRDSVYWRAVRTAANLPVSIAAYAVAVAARATCVWDGDEWLLVCTRPAARIYGGGGTTYGVVFVTPDPRPGACLLRHEARHADQYAFGRGDPVPYWLAYGFAEAVKAATGGFNLFENEAGLASGGYVREETSAAGC